MHRTYGDGYVVIGGKRLYADEDLATGRDATQVRHEEMNALQEEICNVIEAEGLALNSPSESVSSMNQMNTAINNKLKSDRITNQSSVTGANVTDALNNLKSVDDSQQSALSTHTSQIGSLQSSTSSLQSQIDVEEGRNDAQDTLIAANTVTNHMSLRSFPNRIFDLAPVRDLVFWPSQLKSTRPGLQLEWCALEGYTGANGDFTIDLQNLVGGISWVMMWSMMMSNSNVTGLQDWYLPGFGDVGDPSHYDAHLQYSDQKVYVSNRGSQMNSANAYWKLFICRVTGEGENT